MLEHAGRLARNLLGGRPLRRAGQQLPVRLGLPWPAGLRRILRRLGQAMDEVILFLFIASCGVKNHSTLLDFRPYAIAP